MAQLNEIEPYYGWLHLYNPEEDGQSPFHEAEYDPWGHDVRMNNIPVHPLWDTIGSESLLVKVLYADYSRGFAIIELMGEWNDLFENDYKLLAENCLTYFIDNGVNRFVFVCENVFHGYFEADDYYDALQDELGNGWICLLRARPVVLEEMDAYNLAHYFFRSEPCDSLQWRKMGPLQLYEAIAQRIRMVLPE